MTPGDSECRAEDGGLDPDPLKGKEVLVRRYPPLRVAGARLMYNFNVIGSKGRYVEDITGPDFEGWVEREGFFREAGPNADMATLTARACCPGACSTRTGQRTSSRKSGTARGSWRR